MSFLSVTPDSLAWAATDLTSIRSALDGVAAAAAGPTTGLLAAGADEVSHAVATLFANYGDEFQSLSAQVGAFHQGFVHALDAAATTYLDAEATQRALLGTGSTGGPSAATVETLIMGGTGNPLPTAAYVTNIYNAYIAPRIAPLTAIPTGLTTPEQGFPITGLNSLTFDTSIARGVQILQQAIAAQPSGTQTVVFGFSQSATIVTDYLNGIANGSIPAPNPADLRFVLAGNPNNPNGGLYERFTGLYIPGFNQTFGGATPDSAYPTDIYTIQYDGFADFPRYPVNVLSVANALAGMYYGHLSPTPAYEFLTPAQLATAVVSPVSGAGDTTYYMIPSQDLPLLRPFNLPAPLLNMIQPPLRVLVDLGYGDIGGPNTEYANLPTPAGLFPIVNPLAVGSYLLQGTAQGVQANLVLAGLLPPSEMPNAYPFVPQLDPGLTINLGQPSVTVISAITTAVGSGLRALPIPPFGAG